MPDIKSILFPTDFSDFSARALPYATAIAGGFGSKIILLHVEEFLEADPANPAHSFAALSSFTGTVETERVLLRGHAPYKEVLDVSRAKNCDLIVMATHGRSALSQFFLGGSVAEEVARFSTIPVLIVKAEPSEPGESYPARLKEILFTTDLSEASARAFPFAALFAERFKAKLYVLHVIDEESADFYKAKGIGVDDADRNSKIEKLLDDFVASLPGIAAPLFKSVAEGRADSVIERFAEEQEIDLICIATHGHRGIKEEVIGSTTDRVIRRSHCPVLTVRG